VLKSAALTPLARVAEAQGALDLAFLAPIGSLIVVRCVLRPKDGDHLALKTMLHQGPFRRAVLLCCRAEPLGHPSEIETWFIDDLPRLAATLAKDNAST
jgi:hypothetical protein